MIRFDTDDDLIALPDLPNYLPKINGRRINHSTIWRWATRGRNGVLLETLKIGRQRFTTLPATQEFLVASDPLNSNAGDALTHEDADSYLAAEGL